MAMVAKSSHAYLTEVYPVEDIIEVFYIAHYIPSHKKKASTMLQMVHCLQKRSVICTSIQAYRHHFVTAKFARVEEIKTCQGLFESRCGESYAYSWRQQGVGGRR